MILWYCTDMNSLPIQSKTQTEYYRRINKALSFIENNLDNTIHLDDIAGSSHFSPFHFHRIFQVIVGETVNEYVSRKRMEKAVSRLAYQPETTVTEVAHMGGFSSSANFSKAFKLYFGISPTELRKVENLSSLEKDSKIGKLYSKYGKTFSPQELYSQFETKAEVFASDKLEEMLMDVKVEDRDEIQIVFLTSPKGYEIDSVHSTWDNLIKWSNKAGIADKDQKRFGICHDNPVITPEDKCRYDAAIAINSDLQVSSPFNKSIIPAGKYAVAYYKDIDEKISNFMTEIYGNWFVDSAYEPDDYPPIFNYLNDARVDNVVEMNVYIKLKLLQ